MKHIGSDPANPGWTRSYDYLEASLIEPAKQSNRLSKAPLNSDPPSTIKHFDYDLHGNMTCMPHLQIMQWDFKDQRHMTQRQAVNAEDVEGIQHKGERTYYVYDAGGQRVRKVTDRQAGAGQTPTRMKERIYLGGFEIYREYENDGTTIKLERETLHTMDGKERIALVDPHPGQRTRRASATDPLPVRQPPRLGQPGVGSSGGDHLLRGIHALWQFVVSGGMESDGNGEAVSVHGQGEG